MLKKLRRRFVAVTMAVVLVMLSAIFGFVLHSTRRSLREESISMLRSVAQDPLKLDWPGISSSRLPYFTVRIGALGSLRVTGSSYYDLNDTQLLTGIVNAALSGEECGYLPEYNLRYLRTVSYGTGYIVFADVSSESATMRSLGRSCFMIAIGSAALFFLLSLALARWAVRPAESAWRQQRAFVSDASHELKTPLTVILTNAEMLRSGEYDEEDRLRFTDSILSMSRQMRSLVESLLTLARADNGTPEKAMEDVDLSALLEDALLPFEAVFFEKGLTLESGIAPGIRCRGNALHLRQAADILLDNAQKYAQGGTVRVKLEKKGRKGCLISVTTPGEPLTPEECRAVFQRFYRKDKAHSSDGSYGLGLSIAESIAREHRGRIWAEGGENENSFFLQLPTAG